jgi:sulfide:quinone oxidoreductase
VDPTTLATSVPGVYAVGDVTSVGTPKAGVFAEGQAVVVARRIAEQLRGGSPDATYDGRGICYLEFGGDAVAQVDVLFVPGQPPTGTINGPSPDLAADKVAFGAERAQRWFGTAWRPTG